MSFSNSDPAGADQFVRAGVEAAASLRRRQAASRRAWRLAPWLAAACVGLAAVSRSLHWPAVIPLAGLAAAAIALAVRGYSRRRSGPVSDPVAAAIDADAGLGGELRSASWFAGREQRDSWAEHHLGRAAERLRGVSWGELYPPIRARRAQLVTAALVVGTLALSITTPPTSRVWPASTLAPAAAARTKPGPPRATVALSELQQQLEALLAAAESGVPLPRAGMPESAADQRRLLAGLKALAEAGALKDLAHAMTATPGGRSDSVAEMKALAKRIQEAARRPDVPPDVRETLEKAAETLSEDGGKMQSSKEQLQQPGSSRDTKGEMVKGKGKGDVDEATIQSLHEAAGATGAGTVMMERADDSSKKSTPGLGLGGGSDKPTYGGTMADLEAALRRETIEAGMDGPGQTIQTEVRRKTERGTASVTYAHSAAGTFDRGQAVAPPAVPEGRRAAVQSYFIRKQ